MAGAAPHLVEVFSSIQGEGPEVGTRTLFVRFGECDLRCRWCDSPGTWLRTATARLEMEPGVHEEVANPVALATLERAAKGIDLASHRWVSLTGGEPLLQVEAVEAVIDLLAGAGPGIFLETHGLQADALSRVVDRIDLVSMDWKLASDVRRADEPKNGRAAPFHAAHRRFLAVAAGARRVVVKLVITPASEDAEIDEALAAVAEIHPGACVVLQPVTPTGPVQTAPSAHRMQTLERRASRQLGDVRVIPQTHPLMGIP